MAKVSVEMFSPEPGFVWGLIVHHPDGYVCVPIVPTIREVVERSALDKLLEQYSTEGGFVAFDKFESAQLFFELSFELYGDFEPEFVVLGMDLFCEAHGAFQMYLQAKGE